MRLSKLQTKVLRLLAVHRDPESYVAGSTYLARGGMRFSADIDIFHDREDRVARAAEEDVHALQAKGLAVEWQRHLVTIHHEILPLGAVAWAAVEKSLGFTPEGLINEVRRLAHYTAADLARPGSFGGLRHA